MALPPLLIPIAVKAVKLASDPRTIEAAKAAYKTGSEMMEKRKAAAAASPEPEKSETKVVRFLTRRKMFRKGACGCRLRFEITDSDGIKMVREVTDWQSNGKLVIGYCINRKAMREFPISRIIGYEELD
ncbi:MAG: hypothetical protein ACR2O7_03115 [Parasphingorhabdus sp.]